MKLLNVIPRLSFIPFACGALLLANVASAQLGAYRIGDVVTNFALPNRYLWTNDNGQIFPPGGAFRLTDFAGKIVFFEVFAVW